jgi:hypothetical protein
LRASTRLGSYRFAEWDFRSLGRACFEFAHPVKDEPKARRLRRAAKLILDRMRELEKHGHQAKKAGMPNRPGVESFKIARFLHITDARLASRIKRGGLRAPSGRLGVDFVYCVPVTADFSLTHRWTRELRSSGYRSSVAITFVIPDSEKVTIGRFGTPGETMTAAEAVSLFLSDADLRGFQVLVGRKIEPREIRSIRPAPAIVGWRFYPEVREAAFFWPQPGTIKARRKRDRINAEYG